MSFCESQQVLSGNMLLIQLFFFTCDKLSRENLPTKEQGVAAAVSQDPVFRHVIGPPPEKPVLHLMEPVPK